MSLTKEAIEHLEKTRLLELVNEALVTIGPSSPVVALPDSVSVSSLEKYMTKRSSYRFKFETKSVSSYVDYCMEFDKAGAKCFVNPDLMYANTIFDLGSEQEPLHQRHTASLSLTKTAPYQALININAKELSQKAATEFIEDFSDFVRLCSKEGEKIDTGPGIARLRALTIEKLQNVSSVTEQFSESMSAFEKIEAKQKEYLPSFMVFTCVPYGALGPRDFRLRISLLTSDAKPKFKFHIIMLETQEEEMAEEFRQILQDVFENAQLDVLIGKDRE